METIGSNEARIHLPELLERIAKGDRITITEDGVPVAMLVPLQPSVNSEPVAIIGELRKFRQGHRLDGVRLRDLIEEGRRL